MNELISVFTSIPNVDDDGFDADTRSEGIELFASVDSADYIDNYQSMKNDIRATVSFEIRREDFDECRVTSNGKHYYPSIVIWDGAEYRLIRWRYKGLDRAVMICG